ncbi:cytochrome P450 3A24-like isoform X1 [Varroa destructor]|uniref:Cytochrome P450 n=1 Tax=Varroa destructor TaxID=109461 RepID=A0A7M7MJ08_VARDE|nr:cytochrome P450 3A24-like isoform X1 [Varroa destructor]XP_022669249.1 cytochrome P450 3A24-like isoform X1 [Varroa destructor]
MGLLIPIVIVITTLAVGWLLRRQFLEHTFLARYGIPGPKPDLIYGNLLQLKKDRVRVMSQWIKQYGKHFGYYNGAQPVVVCSDLDTLRHILIKESANFNDRPEGPIHVEPFKSSIIFLKGEEWKNVRSALSPLFSTAKMRFMADIMYGCVETFVNIIKKKALKKQTFDMNHVAQGLTLDVICKYALAMDVDCQQSEGGLRLHVKEFFKNAENGAVELSWAFPFLIPMFKVLYMLFASGGLIKSILDNLSLVIRLRRSGEVPKQPDMLQLMLDTQETMGRQKMTDHHIIANSFVFLIAGFETSATALAFITQILVEKPEIQDRIMEEVKRRFPDQLSKGKKLTYEDLHQLKYLDQVIRECMRIYPPVVLMVTRYCPRTCTINGYTFPGGAHVLVPVYHLHHDPKLWDSPEEFRPERFEVDATRPMHPVQFVAFGQGPRICIGMRFALLIIKMTLVELLRNVRLTPGDGFQSPPELIVPNVLINPKGGVHVRSELI